MKDSHRGLCRTTPLPPAPECHVLHPPDVPRGTISMHGPRGPGSAAPKTLTRSTADPRHTPGRNPAGPTPHKAIVPGTSPCVRSQPPLLVGAVAVPRGTIASLCQRGCCHYAFHPLTLTARQRMITGPQPLLKAGRHIPTDGASRLPAALPLRVFHVEHPDGRAERLSETTPRLAARRINPPSLTQGRTRPHAASPRPVATVKTNPLPPAILEGFPLCC